MDIIYQLQGVEFEWDEEKARSNIADHGVTFEEAAEVFFDPFYQGGDASTEDEAREFVMGIPWPNGCCWSSMSTPGGTDTNHFSASGNAP
jgi:Ribonuclease toxin, BrnT, of type II toxin-antitoxin system